MVQHNNNDNIKWSFTDTNGIDTRWALWGQSGNNDELRSSSEKQLIITAIIWRHSERSFTKNFNEIWNSLGIFLGAP